MNCWRIVKGERQMRFMTNGLLPFNHERKKIYRSPLYLIISTAMLFRPFVYISNHRTRLLVPKHLHVRMLSVRTYI